MSDSNAVTMDGRDLLCSEFFLAARQFVASHLDKDEILIMSTSDTSEKNIRLYCGFLGHELKESVVQEGVYYFLIAPNKQAHAA